MVLAGCDRGHGPRVLAALGRSRRPLARPRVGDVVRRRQAQHRLELRPPLGRAPAGCDRNGRPEGGRIPARADVRRALGRGDEARRGARPPRRPRGRPRGDLPADVAGGGDRLARLRPHRGDPGADLLRLRGTRRRAASPGLGGEGCDHGAQRRRGEDARCRCSRSSRRRGARPRASSMSSSRRGTSSSPIRRASSRRPSSTRRPRTSSRTRRGRRARRRASSTSRAASSSRSHARSATRPMPARTTGSTSSPTWAGSWGRGPSSAATRWARRSSSPRAHPTGRRTGCGS